MKIGRSGSFALDAGATFATKIAVGVLGIVTSVIVAKALGPEGRGSFALALSWAGMASQFGNLGLHAANVQMAARDKSLLGPLTGNSLVVSAFMGVMTCAVVLVALEVKPEYVQVRGRLLALTLGWTPVGLAYLLAQNLLIGLQRIRDFNLIELFNRVLYLVLLGVLSAAGAVSAESAVAAGLLAVLACFAWVLWLLRRDSSSSWLPSAAVLREAGSYGLKSYFSALFAFLVMRQALFQVKQELGLGAAGHYSVAVNLADILYMIPVSICTILFPRLAAIEGLGERWAVARRAVWLITAVMMAAGLVSYVMAEWAVRLMFGPEFVPAAWPFVLLALGMVPYAINNVITCFLSARDYPWVLVVPWITAACFNVALTHEFIKVRAMEGAALASAISYVLLLMLNVPLLWWRLAKEGKVR